MVRAKPKTSSCANSMRKKEKTLLIILAGSIRFGESDSSSQHFIIFVSCCCEKIARLQVHSEISVVHIPIPWVAQLDD